MNTPSTETCVILPTLDEAVTVGEVIDGFQREGFSNILVIDGGSTDDTQAIAREHGARVIVQTGTGKGQAVREAREYLADVEYVLMADADSTYRPADAHTMLEPLVEGDADHVIGNRFANMHPDAMSRLNQFGNRLINRAFRTVHKQDLKDILSGYRAFTKEAFDRLYLGVDGFGIETEIAVECVKNDLQTVVVSVHYDPRPDGSETNLSPITHGSHILFTLYRLAKTNNPLFYFGLGGTLSTLAGSGLAAYVGGKWVTTGTSHEVLALIASFGILLGVQLLIFGILSDMLLSYHKAEMREIRRTAEKDS